jgi:hypothetical protein
VTENIPHDNSSKFAKIKGFKLLSNSCHNIANLKKSN